MRFSRNKEHIINNNSFINNDEKDMKVFRDHDSYLESFG